MGALLTRVRREQPTACSWRNQAKVARILNNMPRVPPTELARLMGVHPTYVWAIARSLGLIGEPALARKQVKRETAADVQRMMVLAGRKRA